MQIGMIGLGFRLWVLVTPMWIVLEPTPIGGNLRHFSVSNQALVQEKVRGAGRGRPAASKGAPRNQADFA